MKTHTLLSVTLALSLSAVPAFAQNPPDDQNKVTGSITVGPETGTGLGDSSKLQQYEIVPRGVSLFDVALDWTNGKRYITFDGRKLGLDDQYSSFQAGSKGTWKLHYVLNENPRWFSNTAQTLYAQTDPGVFRLGDHMRLDLQRIWSPAPTDPAAPANSNDNRFWSLRDYMAGAQDVDLRYVRKVGNVGIDYTALENWTFKGSYQRDSRNGTQPLAFTAGPGINEVANPIQYTTQDSRGEIEFNKSRVFVNAAFTYSTFHDAVPFTTVDNPVRWDNTDFGWTSAPAVNTTANATARLWNSPDNTASTFDVTAGFMMPSHHKLTVSASQMTMRNDFTFIPQATNPNLNLAKTDANFGKFTLTPEYSTYNGKLDQTVFLANFTGDPTPKVGYSLMFRSFDLKDKAPSYTFHSTVNSDGGASYSATGTTTDDAGFDNKQYRAEVHVTPATGFRLGANAGGTSANYESREWADVKDTTFGVSADANLKVGMFHGSFSSLSREPGTAVPSNGTALDPGAMMKDLAKRDAKLYNATFTLTPVDQFALSVFASGVDTTLPNTLIGLKTDNVKSYGVDLVFVPTSAVSANVGYVYENISMDSNLWYTPNGTPTTAATNTADQYFNTIGDKVDTYKAGLKLTLVPDKAELGSDFDYSKGRSDSAFTIVPGGANAGGDLLFPTNTTTVNFAQQQYLSMPQVFNELTIWKTYFNFHVDKHVTLGLLYWYQKFNQADYAYDYLAPYFIHYGPTLYASTPGAVTNVYPLLDPSANRALFLGASMPNYNASIFRASLTVRF